MRYDAAGNRVAMTATLPQNGNAPDASRTLSYNYDHLDQLTWEYSQPLNFSMNDPYNRSYGYGFWYDAVGNAQYFRSQGNPSTNNDNQLADPAFQYDGNGNPTTYANIPGMTFDPENHLTTVPGMMQAGYDSDDLRAWKAGASPAGPTPPTYFLYDGDTALLEEDSAGNVLAWNGYGADGLRTRYTTNPTGGASQTLHYAYDPSGNLANRLDPNGQSSNTTIYDAFGQLRAQINTATGQPETNPDPVGFSGQWGAYTDPETMLVLMTHRYYDPSHGRWLNRDPIGYSGGVNLYGYCGNNPVMGVDPSGHQMDVFSSPNGSMSGSMLTLPFGPTADPGVNRIISQQLHGMGFNDHDGWAGVAAGNLKSAGNFARGAIDALEIPSELPPSRYPGRALYARVRGLHSYLDGTQAYGHTTTAIVEAYDPVAKALRYIVGSSAARLPDKVRAKAIEAGEIPADEPGYGEEAALRLCKKLGYQPLRVAASWSICEPCEEVIRAAGAAAVGPLRRNKGRHHR